jgi:hypothetical protein
MKTPEASLAFLPDGTVQGLYTEAISLGAIGRLKIERLSSIEFDHPAQVWRVFDRRGRGLFASPSRSECLRWEQEKLAGAEIKAAVG